MFCDSFSKFLHIDLCFMGQQIVLVNPGTHDLVFFIFFIILFLSFTFPSTSLWKDVFLSTSHHLVMIKTGGLWQPVRGNCTRWMIAGLQKSALVSTLWLLLVLREMKAQVLAPARHVIDWWVCSVWVEGLRKNRSEVKWVFSMHSTTIASNL